MVNPRKNIAAGSAIKRCSGCRRDQRIHVRFELPVAVDVAIKADLKAVSPGLRTVDTIGVRVHEGHAADTNGVKTPNIFGKQETALQSDKRLRGRLPPSGWRHFSQPGRADKIDLEAEI